MVAIKKESIDTSELSYFVRTEMEKGYVHFEVDLKRSVRTGKRIKDFRKVEVRYWREQIVPGKFPCGSCDKLFTNRSALDTHQSKLKHGPFAEPKALYSGVEATAT